MMDAANRRDRLPAADLYPLPPGAPPDAPRDLNADEVRVLAHVAAMPLICLGDATDALGHYLDPAVRGRAARTLGRLVHRGLLGAADADGRHRLTVTGHALARSLSARNASA
jgi:hypothetical protein